MKRYTKDVNTGRRIFFFLDQFWIATFLRLLPTVIGLCLYVDRNVNYWIKSRIRKSYTGSMIDDG